MLRLIMLWALLWPSLLHAQEIDPRKRDSLAGTIERSRQAIRASQDSFLKKQDSIRQARAEAAALRKENNFSDKGVNRNGKQGRSRWRVYIGITIGVLIFIALAALLARSGRRKI